MKNLCVRACVGIGIAALFAANSPLCESTTKSLTIDEFVQSVLKKNPERKFYEQEIRAARANERASDLVENPELELSYGRKSDATREGTAWSVSVLQTFEFPGRLALRKAIANRELKLAELGYERFLVDLAGEARVRAYETLVFQQVAKAASEAARRGEALVGALVQRELAGISPLLEMRVIEASVATLQRKALFAEKEAQESLLALNQLSGEPFSSDIRVVPANITLSPVPNLDTLIGFALEGNFELKMKLQELEAQGFKVNLARNERYPSVKVGPYFSKERASETEEIVGIGLSVPLPVWNQNTEVIEVQASREEQAKTTLVIAQRDIEKRVRTASVMYQKSYAAMQSSRPTLLADLKEASTLADRHYRLGAVPVSTYVELQTQYIEALESILQTQKDALKYLQELETLTGERFKKSFAPEAEKK